MNKILLTKKQVIELVGENKYKVEEKTKILSRCIDGRYENKSQTLSSKFQMPAMAVPGADPGELALVFATANNYGFPVDLQKTWESLVELVGGEKNLQFHTDSHAEQNTVLGGCGHVKQMGLDGKAYDVTSEQLTFIKDQFSKISNQGVKQTVLQGDHQEGAVLLLKGNWGIYPQGKVETDLGERPVQVFIFHQSFADLRRAKLAELLVKNHAVELPDKCDAKYLGNALNEMGENHLMETAKRLAKGLPIYNVVFEENGEYNVEELGEV